MQVVKFALVIGDESVQFFHVQYRYCYWKYLLIPNPSNTFVSPPVFLSSCLQHVTQGLVDHLGLAIRSDEL